MQINDKVDAVYIPDSPSRIKATDYNQIKNEIQKCITEAGLTPTKDVIQLPQALKILTAQSGAEEVAKIEAAGAVQVAAVQQAGATQKDSVNTAGQTQLSAINSVGTAQTEAVNTAGAAQKTAVEAAGAEQINAINTQGGAAVQEAKDWAVKTGGPVEGSEYSAKKYAQDAAQAAASAKTHLPLLFAQWSDHLLEDFCWLRADTFSWQDGAVYTSAYNELLTEYNNAASADETDGSISFKRTPKGYKICAADQHDNVADLYESTGAAWYYILDAANQRFKLPRTKFGFTGLRTGAGNYVAPGLPDHTHQAPYGKNDNGDYHLPGGARPHPATAEWFTTINGYGKDSTPASASNDIYGSSQTVQPPATEMYLYFFVGNFTQSAVEQTAGLNAETINGKADVDGMNAPALMKVPQFWQGADFAKMRAAIMDLDWANAIRTWSSTADSYRTEVMPADGLLAGVLSYSGQIEINGNKYSTGTTDQNWGASYVPFFVKKGDVVKARFNPKFSVLVPFKNQGNADYNPLGFFQYQGQFSDSDSLPTPKINGWALVGNNQLYYVGTDDTGALVWLAGNTITDLGVTGADYVVASYSDASGNWWRKYKSGWIEQGGVTALIPPGTAVTITFFKEFANNSYTIISTPYGAYSNTGMANNPVTQKVTTSFNQASGSTPSASFSWYACGQGAE